MSETGGPTQPGAAPDRAPNDPAPTAPTPTTPTTPTPATSGPSGTPSWATGPIPVTPAADPADPATPEEPRKARPAWLLPVAIVAAVVVVAGIVVAIVLAQNGDDAAAPTPVPTPTIVGPVPTPTIAPAERPNPTDFTSALPASVLQYAFASEKTFGGWVDLKALDAVRDTYSDGGAGAITVDAGQFAKTADAAKVVARIAKGTKVAPTSPCCSLPQQGDVMAGGKKVGTFAIVDLGGGKGQAVWTNGTSLFRITAPSDEVVNAYNAYPL